MPTKTSKPILELNEATVRRGNTNILDRLSLKINMGEHTAIIGPNGSGKSTLIKLLTRKIYPLAPKNGIPPVQLFGKSLWNVETLRSKMGIVTADLQHQFITNTQGGRISGLGVALSGFFGSLRLFPHQKITEEMTEQALDALEKIDAAHLADQMLNTMSSGEVRRVLIARSLITSPDVLVLDEPTTSLDFVARSEFMNRIRSVVQQGTTLILVTHHIEEVIPEIKTVIFLKKGHLAGNGPKNELFTPANLSRVFDSPVSFTTHWQNT